MTDRVCIGFYGFVRDNLPSVEDVTAFLLKIDPTRSTVFDVYISYPILKNETDEFIDSDSKQYVTDCELICPFRNTQSIVTNIRSVLYNYNSPDFINKSRMLGFPDKTSINIYPYRILSLFYGLSILSQFIQESTSIPYKAYIFTRLDKIAFVESVALSDIEDTICKCLSTSNPEVVDKYFMVFGKNAVNALCNLYEYSAYNYSTDDTILTTEKMLYSFLSQQETLILEEQNVAVLSSLHKNSYGSNYEYFDHVLSTCPMI